MKAWRVRRLLLLALIPATAACARTQAQWAEDLGSPDPFVRGMAAIGMSLQSPREAGPALEELLKTIDRVDVGLQQAAARTLVDVAPHQVPALLDALVRDEFMSAEKRRAITAALVATGPAAADPIVACLCGPGRHLVGDLGDVLLAIGAPALPAIVAMLEQEEDVKLQNFAAFLLARIGPRARSALPSLQRVASSPDPDLRRMASEAIASIEGRPWQVPVPGERER